MTERLDGPQDRRRTQVVPRAGPPRGPLSRPREAPGRLGPSAEDGALVPAAGACSCSAQWWSTRSSTRSSAASSTPPATASSASSNYATIFTDSSTLTTIRNNLIWVVGGSRPGHHAGPDLRGADRADPVGDRVQADRVHADGRLPDGLRRDLPPGLRAGPGQGRGQRHPDPCTTRSPPARATRTPGPGRTTSRRSPRQQRRGRHQAARAGPASPCSSRSSASSRRSCRRGASRQGAASRAATSWPAPCGSTSPRAAAAPAARWTPPRRACPA